MSFNDTKPTEDVDMNDVPTVIPVPDCSQPYPQSHWATLTVPSSSQVTPYTSNPNYAANAITLSLSADRATPDPLLTRYSTDSWTSTVLLFIAHGLGPRKWPAYRNIATVLLTTASTPIGRDKSAYGAMTDLLTDNDLVAYLHNDLAYQLNGTYSEVLPIFDDLEPAGGLFIRANGQAGIVKRIAQDWDREFWLDGKRMPRSGWARSGRVADRSDEASLCFRCREEALGFLGEWKGEFPGDMEGLVEKMKGTML